MSLGKTSLGNTAVSANGDFYVPLPVPPDPDPPEEIPPLPNPVPVPPQDPTVDVESIHQPIFAQRIINPAIRINTASGVSHVELCSGGNDGVRLNSVVITSNDSIGQLLEFSLTGYYTTYVLGQVKIPALSGADGSAAVPSVALKASNFPAINNDGYLFIRAGYKLMVRVKTVLVAGKQIDIVGFGGEY